MVMSSTFNAELHERLLAAEPSADDCASSGVATRKAGGDRARVEHSAGDESCRTTRCRRVLHSGISPHHADRGAPRARQRRQCVAHDRRRETRGPYNLTPTRRATAGDASAACSNARQGERAREVYASQHMSIVDSAHPISAADAVKPVTRQATWGLTLLALGVVYGDIGTSPLYAARETFNPDHGIPFTQANILGGISAIFWALMVVVSLKYVTLVLRADNRGEGGIMALLALAARSVGARPRMVTVLRTIGVFGAALFYGDAVLTPAISVLSAVEGLEVGTPAFKPYVIPIAVGVLVALFAIQRHGTGTVGKLFGPICALWFASLAVDGIWNIAKAPVILEALNPVYALRFATSHGVASFLVLGSVLLAITGAEALYADMGHFGKRAIRVAWFGLVGAGTRLELLRSGRAADFAAVGATESIFSRLPGMGALSHGRARDGGDGDCIAGDDLGRLFDDAAGDPARLSSASRDSTHFRQHDGADLHSCGELDIARCGDHRRHRIWLFVAACERVRRRGDGHDADHDSSDLLRDPLRLSLPAAVLRARSRASLLPSTLPFLRRRCTSCSRAAGCRLRWRRSCSRSWSHGDADGNCWWSNCASLRFRSWHFSSRCTRHRPSLYRAPPSFARRHPM